MKFEFDSPPHSTNFFALIFSAGELRCALPCDPIEEIVPIASTSAIPGQPEILDGFLNLRGASVPVVRFNRLFHLAAQESGAYTPFIIVRTGAARAGALKIGLRVDRVLEVLEVEKTQLETIPADESLNGCATARFTVGGAVTVLLGWERLLLAEERERLGELAEKEQQRLAAIERSHG